VVDLGQRELQFRRPSPVVVTKAAEAHDRAEQARKVLTKDGLTYLDRFEQPTSRPEVAIERDSRLAFARLLRELNLETPTADSRPPALKYPRR